MNNPFITIVHNQNNNYCKLLVLYDEHNVYYSKDKTYLELIRFKKATNIEQKDNILTLHTKNNILTLKKKKY